MSCIRTIFFLALVGCARGTTTRMQLLRKYHCSPNRKVLGARNELTACGLSDMPGTEGLTLPGMEDGTRTTREDIILVGDGMAKVTAFPNRPYKYLLAANSDHYSKYEEIFGGVSRVLSEGVMDFNSDSESKGSALRHLSNLTQYGFTEGDHTVLDGVRMRVFIGYASNIRGAEALDNFAKEGLAANFFILYMDEKLDGKLVKMEARNSYDGNVLVEEVLVTTYQMLGEDMTISDAIEELHRSYSGTICDRSVESLQLYFAKAAGNNQSVIPPPFYEQYVTEDERDMYKAYEGRWDELDWLRFKLPRRHLRTGAQNEEAAFQPIEYFTIEPNSAAEAFFKNEPRRLIALTFKFPKDCELDKKTHDDLFCVHLTLDTKEGLDYIDVSGSFYDHYNPNTTRIGAGFKLVQKDAEAVDLHISGGGAAVVYSTDGEVRLEATAKLEILDGGNPRHFEGEVEIACGYVLSGGVSLKADKTDLLTATFGGVGVIGGGKNNLLGNYLPLEGGLESRLLMEASLVSWLKAYSLLIP